MVGCGFRARQATLDKPLGAPDDQVAGQGQCSLQAGEDQIPGAAGRRQRDFKGNQSEQPRGRSCVRLSPALRHLQGPDKPAQGGLGVPGQAFAPCCPLRAPFQLLPPTGTRRSALCALGGPATRGRGGPIRERKEEALPPSPGADVPAVCPPPLLHLGTMLSQLASGASGAISFASWGSPPPSHRHVTVPGVSAPRQTETRLTSPGSESLVGWGRGGQFLKKPAAPQCGTWTRGRWAFSPFLGGLYTERDGQREGGKCWEARAQRVRLTSRVRCELLELRGRGGGWFLARGPSRRCSAVASPSVSGSSENLFQGPWSWDLRTSRF
ncbi:uncharacterized protein [Vicugna pacos]|uniref:Uncharacterized protein n=1 Tax=Vicugna pacos TaxID=30538 RepID=A0A6J3A3D3_VICPA|nr:uncharacterized protein LOC116277723 [Vicugna pacos]XP_031528209.1 uncharacterized protein LOC116277723 [Vicugna pacos]